MFGHGTGKHSSSCPRNLSTRLGSMPPIQENDDIFQEQKGNHSGLA